MQVFILKEWVLRYIKKMVCINLERHKPCLLDFLPMVSLSKVTNSSLINPKSHFKS